MSNETRRSRQLAWSQVDVFAEAPLEGNMLAIFHDGTGLSGAEMQALARETNLSETTFVLPRSEAEERQNGVRVRIFTTQEELPFAGHPTLGTASWLRMNHARYRDATAITLDLNSGPVTVRFAEGQKGIDIVGEMTQHDPLFGVAVSRDEAAAALGLDANDLHAGLSPQVISTGLPFLIVPLRGPGEMGRLAVSNAGLHDLLHACAAHFIYCIAPAPADTGATHWRARMPFYSGEDPATGSAAGCAISYLVQHGVVTPDAPVVIRQGVEVRRPSRITVRAGMQDGSVRDVRVGGRTIPVATGRFFLP